MHKVVGVVIGVCLAACGLLCEAQDLAPRPEPSPLYGVRVENSVMIPMQDGVRLATDIYFPKSEAPTNEAPTNEARTWPVILIRTPYGKSGFGGRMQHLAEMMAGQGYAVAVQDERGRYESEGSYIIFGSVADDGNDTIDWLSSQRWSNGRVGTYGCSSLGDNQILAAQRRPPALKAMIPQASFATIGSAGGQYKYYGVRTGGAVALAQNISWFYQAGSKVNPAPPLKPANYPALWWHLPIVDVMTVAGAPPNDFADAVSRGVTDP